MNLFEFLGFVFLTSFLITYKEYQYHFPDKKLALKHSLKTGFFAFLVFFTIAVLAGLTFSKI